MCLQNTKLWAASGSAQTPPHPTQTFQVLGALGVVRGVPWILNFSCCTFSFLQTTSDLPHLIACTFCHYSTAVQSALTLLYPSTTVQCHYSTTIQLLDILSPFHNCKFSHCLTFLHSTTLQLLHILPPFSYCTLYSTFRHHSASLHSAIIKLLYVLPLFSYCTFRHHSTIVHSALFRCTFCHHSDSVCSTSIQLLYSVHSSTCKLLYICTFQFLYLLSTFNYCAMCILSQFKYYMYIPPSFNYCIHCPLSATIHSTTIQLLYVQYLPWSATVYFATISTSLYCTSTYHTIQLLYIHHC